MTTPTTATDDTKPNDLPPSGLFAAFFALHTLFGFLAAVAGLAACTVIRSTEWRAFVGGLAPIFTTVAVALGVKYQSPRERSIMEEHDPTPVRARKRKALAPTPEPEATVPTPHTPPSSPPPGLLLVLLLAPLLSACSAAQIAAWRTTGIDVLKCTAPKVVDAAGDALTQLLPQLDPTAGQFDYAKLGQDLAMKYGVDAALCAIGKAWANLAPTVGMKPSYRAVALSWLVEHQGEWVPKGSK